jgi:hypothetical protein
LGLSFVEELGRSSVGFGQALAAVVMVVVATSSPDIVDVGFAAICVGGE